MEEHRDRVDGGDAPYAEGREARAARYVYCVARAAQGLRLGPIGIEGREVYTAGDDDLCAVVHDGPPRPYQSEDPETVAGWVLAHHRVVEDAWSRWGSVLPVSFNTIIGPDRAGAEKDLAAWLALERDALTRRLAALAGKAEYGVQVSWDPAVVAAEAARSTPEIAGLGERMRAQSQGTAYLSLAKLRQLLRREVERRATAECAALYRRIRGLVDDIRVERTVPSTSERQMLVNLSCLVSLDRAADLAMEVDAIGTVEGRFVHFVGPLPPYSFC